MFSEKVLDCSHACLVFLDWMGFLESFDEIVACDADEDKIGEPEASG
jgi:hypothetical protein